MSDEKKKQLYDTYGHDMGPKGFGGGGGGGSYGGFGGFGGGGFSMEDIFANFGDIFGDAFQGAGSYHGY